MGPVSEGIMRAMQVQDYLSERKDRRRRMDLDEQMRESALVMQLNQAGAKPVEDSKEGGGYPGPATDEGGLSERVESGFPVVTVGKRQFILKPRAQQLQEQVEQEGKLQKVRNTVKYTDEEGKEQTYDVNALPLVTARESRAFQRGEAETTRTFQKGEAETTRTFQREQADEASIQQAEQGRLTRQTQRDIAGARARATTGRQSATATKQAEEGEVNRLASTLLAAGGGDAAKALEALKRETLKPAGKGKVNPYAARYRQLLKALRELRDTKDQEVSDADVDAAFPDLGGKGKGGRAPGSPLPAPAGGPPRTADEYKHRMGGK